jgi:hypothetical protein
MGFPTLREDFPLGVVVLELPVGGSSFFTVELEELLRWGSILTDVMCRKRDNKRCDR